MALLHLPAISRDAMLLDKSVRTIIERRLNDCHQRAEAIIQSNRATTLAMADALNRNGYLDRAAIAAYHELNAVRCRSRCSTFQNRRQLSNTSWAYRLSQRHRTSKPMSAGHRFHFSISFEYPLLTRVKPT